MSGHGAAGGFRRTTATVVVAVGLGLAACGTPLGASPTTTRPAPTPSAARSALPFGRAAAGSAPSPPLAVGDPTSSPVVHSAGPSGTGATDGTAASDGDGMWATGPGAQLIDAFYRLPSPLGPGPPGSIIRSGPIGWNALLPAGAVATRVIYHSESITGADIAVSGVVVVPGGAAPPGGFPIVSWAHGTTGLADQCAPSVAGPSSIFALSSLIEDRMIVVATDYQGLGTPGIHPYLVGQSEAQGVLDAARAARNLEGGAASNTVLVIGYSQGGQAALFADQIAGSYAPELFVAGVAAVAPVASLTELAPTTPASGPDGDAGFAAMALYAWSATYANFSLASVLTTTARRNTAVMTSACSAALNAVYGTIPADLVFRPGWDADPAVRVDEADNQPGQAPASAPLLVVQGTKDALVPYADTSALVSDSLCRGQHDTVRYVPIVGASHQGALTAGATTIMQWISNRVAGLPPANSCPGAATPG